MYCGACSASPLGHGLRSAVDNQYIRGLVWAERKNLLIALICALICTCSNLAAPVIAGFLLEILAGRQPLELYPKVRPCAQCMSYHEAMPPCHVNCNGSRLSLIHI